MKMRADIEVHADITIDSEEAEILNHICSYDVAKEFASRYSRRFTEERIREKLTAIREATGKILAARDEARKAIEGKPRDRNEVPA